MLPALLAPSEDHLLEIVKQGLPPTLTPKRVLILGAGMAGLAAAYESQRAGHHVVVPDAHSRVGGRVETLRTPFSYGLYGEAGAMRIPKGHRLSMAYIDKFGLTYS